MIPLSYQFRISIYINPKHSQINTFYNPLFYHTFQEKEKKDYKKLIESIINKLFYVYPTGVNAVPSSI